MGTAGRPSSGARYVLEQVVSGAGVAEGEGTSVVYRGFIHLPEEDIAVAVHVALPDGATRATLEGGDESDLRKELSKMAAALVRSATKSGTTTGSPLPRKIVRWRTCSRQ